MLVITYSRPSAETELRNRIHTRQANNYELFSSKEPELQEFDCNPVPEFDCCPKIKLQTEMSQLGEGFVPLDDVEFFELESFFRAPQDHLIEPFPLR